MPKRSVARLLTNGLAVIALFGASRLQAQETPRISTDRRGETIVTFANDCRVVYDASGQYQRRSDNCSREQQRHADEALARYRREQGSNEVRPSGHRSEESSGWSAGSANRVYQNIDARASGYGRTDMVGIKGNGSFAAVRARLGTGGDAIIDVADPTDGQIRGRVESVQGRAVRLNVTAVYGYRATGNLTVELSDANTVRAMSGSGNGEHGPWSLSFPMRR